MKDNDIFSLHAFQAKNVYRIHRQVMFMQTRIEAYEAVLSHRWNVLRGIFQPQKLMKMVDQYQLMLIKEFDKQEQESAQRIKEERVKPKLTVVGANGILNGR